MKPWLTPVKLCATLCLVGAAFNNNAEPATTPSEATSVAAAFAGLAQSELYQAYTALFAELTPILDAGDPKRIAALKSLKFSKESRQKLIKAFGNDHPLHLKGSRKKNGDAELVFSLDPAHDSGTEISAVTGKAEFDGKVRRRSFQAEIPSIRGDDSNGVVGTFSDLRYAEKTQKGSLGLWMGTAGYTLRQFSSRVTPLDVDVIMDNSAMRVDLTQRGLRVDMDFDSTIQSIHWGSDGLGPIHLAARVADLDGKALATYVQSNMRLQASDLAENARAAVLRQTGASMLQAVMQQGLAIDIQDLSIQYHGMTARMDGRIAWSPGMQLSAATPFTEGMELRLNVRIPMAMANTFLHSMAASQVRAALKPKQEVPPKELEKLIKDQSAAMLAAALSVGFVRVENDSMTSTIEIKSSQTLLNGHVIPTGNERP